MNIYTYFVFSYGLTIIIAFFTVGIILMVNKLLQVFDSSAKQ